MDVTNLKIISQGRTATVYQLENGLILKAFKQTIPISEITREFKNSQTVYNIGLPTPKPYEIVACANHYGIVYESYVGVKTFEEMLAEDNCDYKHVLTLFAKSVKQLHMVHVPAHVLADVKEVLADAITKLATRYGPEKTSLLKKFLQHIPDGDSFLHMDCHLGNCFYNKQRPTFFDFTYSTKGYPLFDLCGMYAHYIFWPPQKDVTVVTKKANRKLFDCFLAVYLHTHDVAKLKAATRQISAVYALIVVLGPVVAPGLYTEAMLVEAFALLEKDTDWFCEQDIIC